MSDTKIAEEEQAKYGAHEVPSIHEAPVGVLEEGSLDPVYEAKARVLNKAIQDIGMGRYQWQVSTQDIGISLHKLLTCRTAVYRDWIRLGHGQSVAYCHISDPTGRQD
jgi:hypothetical protein